MMLLLALVGLALWYAAVVLVKNVRRAGWHPGHRADPAPKVTSASGSDTARCLARGWTALDDQQLTRLLKGTAP
jgi:hypothetical protein